MVTTRKMDQSGNAVMKDHILVDYNLGMGFVNKNNTITTQHTMVRKSNKWTTKVALHRESIQHPYPVWTIFWKHPNEISDFKLQKYRR